MSLVIDCQSYYFVIDFRCAYSKNIPYSRNIIPCLFRAYGLHRLNNVLMRKYTD